MNAMNRMLTPADLHALRIRQLSAHEHAWSPIDGERARYSCPCGEQAHRSLRGGELKLVARKHHVPTRGLDARSGRAAHRDGLAR